MPKRGRDPDVKPPPSKKGRNKKDELLGRDKDCTTTVRKTKLNSALLEERLRAPILAQVDAYAKLTHQATILSNLVVDHAVRTGRFDELPTNKVVMQQFMQSCMKAVRDYPNHCVTGRNSLPKIITDVLDASWTKPEVEWTKPNSYMLNPVCTELTTNAVNHCFVHYYDRQERALRRATYDDIVRAAALATFKKSNPSEISIRNKVATLRQALINAPEYTGTDRTVLIHRAHIHRKPGETINHLWLKKNLGRALVYYHFIGSVEFEASEYHQLYHAQHGKVPPNWIKAKTFSLLPIRGYGLHALPIEANGLFGLLKASGILPSTARGKDFTPVQMEWFTRCFDFARFAKLGRVHVNCRVTTDGTSCSLSYFIPGGKTKSKKTSKKKEEIPYQDRIDLSTKTSGLFTEKNCRLDDTSTVVGCDPGRHSLITLGKNGKFLHYGKREHYDRCFYKRGQQKRDKWNWQASAETAAAIAVSSQQSFLIGNDLAAAWTARAPLEPLLWKHYGDSRWRNLRFTQWSRKQKAYTDLVRRIRKEFGRDTVFAMGAAKFKVTAVGDVSGPLVEMATELSRHFRVVYTDEFRSSLGCFTCSQQTSSVRRPGVGAKGSVFCIRRCEQCRRYRNRDCNAALNIGEFAQLRLQNKSVRANFVRGTSTWLDMSYRRPLCGFATQ